MGDVLFFLNLNVMSLKLTQMGMDNRACSSGATNPIGKKKALNVGSNGD